MIVLARSLFCILALSSVTLPLAAQPRVPAAFRGERLIAVVPLTGKGTYEDPRRPLFAPAPGVPGEPGIQGFKWQPTDDGQAAIVEFVATDAAALQALAGKVRDLADRQQRALVGGPPAAVFERGRSRKEDLERELQRRKRGFSLDAFVGTTTPPARPVAGGAQ